MVCRMFVIDCLRVIVVVREVRGMILVLWRLSVVRVVIMMSMYWKIVNQNGVWVLLYVQKVCCMMNRIVRGIRLKRQVISISVVVWVLLVELVKICDVGMVVVVMVVVVVMMKKRSVWMFCVMLVCILLLWLVVVCLLICVKYGVLIESMIIEYGSMKISQVLVVIVVDVLRLVILLMMYFWRIFVDRFVKVMRNVQLVRWLILLRFMLCQWKLGFSVRFV